MITTGLRGEELDALRAAPLYSSGARLKLACVEFKSSRLLCVPSRKLFVFTYPMSSSNDLTHSIRFYLDLKFSIHQLSILNRIQPCQVLTTHSQATICHLASRTIGF